MADLIDVITKATQEASPDDFPELEQDDTNDEVDEGSEETTEEESTEESTEESSTEESTTEEKPADTRDELDKQLETYGIKRPAQGERENRLPYKRVKRIVENALKKAAESHRLDLEGKLKEFDPYKSKASQWDMIEKMVDADPDGYIRRLAIANPNAYGKFMKVLEQAVADNKPEVVAIGEEPQPDVVYENGAKGYSPEQWAKRETWLKNAAVMEAESRISKKFESRLAPYEQATKARAHQESAAKVVKEQMARATQVWGELFTNKTNQDEIDKYMKANPGLPFDAACSAVLTPKLKLSQDQQRQVILKELNERRKAAKKPVGSSQSKVVVDTKPGERSTEDVIMEVLKKNKMV